MYGVSFVSLMYLCQLNFPSNQGDFIFTVYRQAVVNFVKGAGETKFSYDRQESLIYVCFSLTLRDLL